MSTAADPLKGYDLSLDYYAVLSVSANATDNEIRRAYRKLALSHHPDKQSTQAGAAELKRIADRFHDISQAHILLSDPVRRAAYDAHRRVRLEKEQWKAKLSQEKRKMRDDLEELERRAEEKLKKQRMEKSVIDTIREENRYAIQQLQKRQRKITKIKAQELSAPPIKIRWASGMDVTESLLNSLFKRKYGAMESAVIKKRKAVILFRDIASSIRFMEGYKQDDLLNWIETSEWAGVEEGHVPEAVLEFRVQEGKGLHSEKQSVGIQRQQQGVKAVGRKVLDENKEADILKKMRELQKGPHNGT